MQRIAHTSAVPRSPQVVGYDHFNYNWGWRGADANTYGNGVSMNITKYDYHRIHTFRDLEAYEEEARRMKLVCGNFDAKVCIA